MCMEQDSVDILQSGLIEHYMQQSDELEETSLARFAAWYAFQSSKRICKQIQTLRMKMLKARERL